MSRGFVREGDQEETPLVPPRAHLPAGVVNYVTPSGLQALKDEEEALTQERAALIAQSIESNRVQINYLSSKLGLLLERLNAARVVDLNEQPQDEVQFGATVTLYKEQEKCESTYQIVGVDEANVAQNKVSFLSPLARVLQNKKAGETITLKTPKGERIMKVMKVEYR